MNTDHPDEPEEVEDTPVVQHEPSSGTVPMERFVASQQVVGALLAERERIMDALIGLVNASHPYRNQGITLAHVPRMNPAWETAYALCKAWEQSKRQQGPPPA